MMDKMCSWCYQIKDISEFNNKCRRKKDVTGRIKTYKSINHLCKDCEKAYMRQYQKNYRELLKGNRLSDIITEIKNNADENNMISVKKVFEILKCKVE